MNCNNYGDDSKLKDWKARVYVYTKQTVPEKGKTKMQVSYKQCVNANLSFVFHMLALVEPFTNNLQKIGMQETNEAMN